MVGNKTGSDQKLTVAMWDELVGHVESGSRNFFNAYIGLLEEISTIKEGLEACNFNYVRHQ